MFLMAIFLKKILILVQGISWKRCPQLPVPPRIDSLHWMSVRSKYLLYEIRDINKLFFFFLWSVSFKYNFLKYYAIHMCVPYSWLIYNSALSKLQKREEISSDKFDQSKNLNDIVFVIYFFREAWNFSFRIKAIQYLKFEIQELSCKLFFLINCVVDS